MADAAGPLIIIGGHEDKEDQRVILKAVAERLNGGRLVIATVASHTREGYFDSYVSAFGALGVTDLVELYVEDRSQEEIASAIAVLDGAAGLFFTGGDQLRLSSLIGRTAVETRIQALHAAGGVVAGTSAGASAMSETMLVKGASKGSYRIGELHMAPGLGLLGGVIIDQHFAERGRFGRLLGAVAHNPRLLGVGVDENTALVVESERFDVIGSGAAYVVDGGGVSHVNIAEAKPEQALSLFDVRMHVLSSGDSFDLSARRPEGGRHEAGSRPPKG